MLFRDAIYFSVTSMRLPKSFMRSSLLVGLFVKDLVVNFWPNSSQRKDSDMIKQFIYLMGTSYGKRIGGIIMGLFFLTIFGTRCSIRDFFVRTVDRRSYKMFNIISGLFNARFDRLLLHKVDQFCQLFSVTFGRKNILHSGTIYKCRSLPRMVGSLGKRR